MWSYTRCSGYIYLQDFCKWDSLFSHVFDKHKSQSGLSNDLQVISNWAFLWKMQFNPDPNKQVQEIHFSKKSNNEISLPVTFNNSKAVTCSNHKHLGLLLDKWLSFNEHIQSKMNKCYKLIGAIKRLSVILLCDALLRIYKSFIRPHLDYRDIIYDKPHNEKQNWKYLIKGLHCNNLCYSRNITGTFIPWPGLGNL